MPEVGITTCNLPQPVQALERVIIQHIWYSTPGIDLTNIRGRLFNRSAFHLSICMGINQSSLQVCMPQPLRNQCKLHAVLVKMHRSTVAEVVWVQIGRYRRTSAPCAVSIQPQQLPQLRQLLQMKQLPQLKQPQSPALPTQNPPPQHRQPRSQQQQPRV